MLDCKLSANQIILIFVGIMGLFIVVMAAKKIYYYTRFRKRFYIFPKIDSKGIANVAMVISISISIIILLTVLSAGLMGIVFRAYPGWRVTIEGVLIKIGGLLFGPIIGIFIGAATDILTVALTAGMFHYGFFFCSILYGFLAGIIRGLLNTTKKNTLAFAILGTVFIAISAMVIDLYIYYVYTGTTGGDNPIPGFAVTFFGKDFNIGKGTFVLIINGFQLLFAGILWAGLLVFEQKRIKLNAIELDFFLKFSLKKLYYRFLLKKKISTQAVSIRQMLWHMKTDAKEELYKTRINNLETFVNSRDEGWFYYFAPVILIVMFGEPIVSIIVMPPFDHQLGGGMPLGYWIPLRGFSFIPISILNMLIIFPVYRTIGPNLKYNYRDSILENASVPLIS